MIEKTNQQNEVVQITKGQLEGILAELDNLRKGQKLEKPKRVTDRVARLRFHNGKPVVWYGNVREIKDNLNGKLVSFMDIKTLKSEELEKVEYLAFLNSNNAVNVSIKEQRAEKIIESQGKTLARNPNPHFNKKFEEFEYEEEVVSYQYEATVEVLEGEHKGEIFEVPTKCLNS